MFSMSEPFVTNMHRPSYPGLDFTKDHCSTLQPKVRLATACAFSQQMKCYPYGDAHCHVVGAWLQVAIMIFVGFGFLMTFLKRYSYSALGLNFFCSCIVILEALLVIGAVQQVRNSTQQVSPLPFHRFSLSR